MKIPRITPVAGVVALAVATLLTGQTNSVTTPVTATTSQGWTAGTAESVTGTEKEVVARFAVTTTTTSTATEHLRVSTSRPPEPPPAPVVAKEPEPVRAEVVPPPAPQPAPRMKELPRTDSPLPLMAGLGGLLLFASGLTRYLGSRLG